MATSPNVNVRNLTGGNGSVFVNSDTAVAGDFYAIQFLKTTQIDALTGNMENSAALISANHEFSSGEVIYGRFQSVQIDNSGACLIYRS
tara:strand:- start:20512 stop:20778 length:267 start_codon:yes stop_codon:yes gene_type:complete